MSSGLDMTLDAIRDSRNGPSSTAKPLRDSNMHSNLEPVYRGSKEHSDDYSRSGGRDRSRSRSRDTVPP